MSKVAAKLNFIRFDVSWVQVDNQQGNFVKNPDKEVKVVASKVKHDKTTEVKEQAGGDTSGNYHASVNIAALCQAKSQVHDRI